METSFILKVMGDSSQEPGAEVVIRQRMFHCTSKHLGLKRRFNVLAEFLAKGK